MLGQHQHQRLRQVSQSSCTAVLHLCVSLHSTLPSPEAAEQTYLAASAAATAPSSSAGSTDFLTLGEVSALGCLLKLGVTDGCKLMLGVTLSVQISSIIASYNKDRRAQLP